MEVSMADLMVAQMVAQMAELWVGKRAEKKAFLKAETMVA